MKGQASVHPKPADQLHIPPIGSKLKFFGHVYSHPIILSLSILAQYMNFLQDNGWGKFPWSRHSIIPLVCNSTLLCAGILPKMWLLNTKASNFQMIQPTYDTGFNIVIVVVVLRLMELLRLTCRENLVEGFNRISFPCGGCLARSYYNQRPFCGWVSTICPGGVWNEAPGQWTSCGIYQELTFIQKFLSVDWFGAVKHLWNPIGGKLISCKSLQCALRSSLRRCPRIRSSDGNSFSVEPWTRMLCGGWNVPSSRWIKPKILRSLSRRFSLRNWDLLQSYWDCNFRPRFFKLYCKACVRDFNLTWYDWPVTAECLVPEPGREYKKVHF